MCPTSDYMSSLSVSIRQKKNSHLYLASLSDTPLLPLEIAEDAPRNDYIVLEAILFPGINLFWAGSLIMLMGMFIGMYKRLRKT